MGDDRGYDVLPKLLPILADELHVGVTAAEEDELFRSPGGGEPFYHLEECRVRLNRPAGDEVHYPTCITWAARIFPHDD